MSKSGVQNRKRIVVRNPMIPVAKALVKIPRPATTLRFDVNERHEKAGKTRCTSRCGFPLRYDQKRRNRSSFRL